MIIDKTFSKTELVEIINELDLKIVHSHANNKRELQDKIIEYINNKKMDMDPNNIYNIKTRDGLIFFLTNKNPKKILSIKEKNNVMNIAKNIINYTKQGYQIEASKYETFQDLIDDMHFIKQFGEIPSVRRACRLMNKDDNIGVDKFIPLISPQLKKILDDKKLMKQKYSPKIVIKRSTPTDPIILTFD
jgi:hypothetical protein